MISNLLYREKQAFEFTKLRNFHQGADDYPLIYDVEFWVGATEIFT